MYKLDETNFHFDPRKRVQDQSVVRALSPRTRPPALFLAIFLAFGGLLAALFR
jgi:hypothetical protein